jgi:hypothetical protein
MALGKGTGRPRNYASVREVARTKRPEDGSGNICARMRVPRSVAALLTLCLKRSVHYRFWSNPNVGFGANDSGPQTVYVPATSPVGEKSARLV